MLGHTMFNVGRCFNADQNGILRPTGGKLGLGIDSSHERCVKTPHVLRGQGQILSPMCSRSCNDTSQPVAAAIIL